MRKVVLSLATSFDGFIEGPNRETDWLTFDEETGKALHSFLAQIDTVLYGRVSYEQWGEYEPPENSSPSERDFYTRLKNMNRIVFSAGSLAVRPGVLVSSNVKSTIAELKSIPGKDIWLYGGSGLITSFMKYDMIDEFRIAVSPIILGAGKPLFSDIDHRVKLNLISVSAGNSGVVEFRYERATG